MLKKFPLYWRYQLWGWFFYVVIILLFAWINRGLFLDSDSIAPLAIRVFVLGILTTHVMRLAIKRLKILELPFSRQGFYFFIITNAFSLLFIIMLNLTLENFGFLGGITTATIQMLNGIFFLWLIITGALLVWNLFYFIVHYVDRVRREEEQRAALRYQLLELEAKSLRSQMNPHFIFNCMNSIKSLIQEQKDEKAVTYLTTFSKLIRNLLNSADKKEISLYDEIETCKLYLQLEAMRFDTKFSYEVNVDATIDLKSVQVPALIIQPFIENAIWHGIVPRNNGGQVSLNVLRKDDVIEVVINDDGVGREASERNKSVRGLTHQSKGVNLTQSRLELNNLLRQRQAELKIIDKKDEKGAATGTTVLLNFKESA